MFSGKHALFKRFRSIAGVDRHLGLAEYLASIQLFGHDMNRATARRIACFERAAARRAFNRTLRQNIRVEPELASLYT